MSSRVETETFGGGYSGILLAICFQAYREYSDPELTRTTMTVYQGWDPADIRREAKEFLFDDELFDAICFHLGMDAENVRRVMDATSKRNK